MKEYILYGFIKITDEDEWTPIPELTLRVTGDINPYEALDQEIQKIAKYWLITLKQNLDLE